ncbi:MAG: response regulator [Desulfuromonadales bacterium]|nr:response regulator [Desulfuromonadales bacterium]
MSKQILVVDHSDERRNQLTNLLLERDIQTLEAASCEEALQLLRQGTIHLVLTESELPAKSGLYLLKTIKEVSPEVEIILITHNASSFNLLQALRLGAYDFIVRPIDTGEILFNAIERAFRQIQLRQENQQLLRELEQQNRSLQRAHKMMQALNKSVEKLAVTVEIEPLLRELLACAMAELHANRGLLALFDRSGDQLALKIGEGIAQEACRAYSQGLPSGLILTLAQSGQPVVLPGPFPDGLAAEVTDWERDQLLSSPGLLAAPLRRHDRLLGLVLISGRQKEDPFGEPELNFLIQLAHHAVLAMEKVGIIYQLKRGRLNPAA